MRFFGTKTKSCDRILRKHWRFSDEVRHLYQQHLFGNREGDREWSRLLSKKANPERCSMFRSNTLCSRAAERAGMGLMLRRSSTRSMILLYLLFLVISSSSISVLLQPFKNGSLGVKDTLEPAIWSFCLRERRPPGTWSARERYATCICISPPPSSSRSPPRQTLILIQLSSWEPSACSTPRSRPLRSRCSRSFAQRVWGECST